MSKPLIYYWSSGSAGTHRFAKKLTTTTLPIGHFDTESHFIILTPTYGSPKVPHIPPQVTEFLNRNQKHLVGVIGTGNRNFGDYYCQAAKEIRDQYSVPLLRRVELFGNEEDVKHVDQGIEYYWDDLIKIKAHDGVAR